jgi:hypothetical protein
MVPNKIEFMRGEAEASRAFFCPIVLALIYFEINKRPVLLIFGWLFFIAKAELEYHCTHSHMNKAKRFFSIVAISVVGTSIAHAQASRTWVSGVGDDANPCSRTAPCKTFAGAISKTAAGGEIDALDPGGFGAVTITKAITIDGGGGQVASVLVSGTNGIVIQAAATDAVTIRNISIQGLDNGLTGNTNGGLNGIRFLSGKALHIEHCSLMQFRQNGIDIEPTNAGAQVFVSDTISQDNGGGGLYAIGPGNFITVTLDNARFENNTNGVKAADYTRFSIRNTAASGSSQAGFIAQPNAGMAVLSIANSTSANNGVGLQSGGGTASASVRIAGLSLFLNGSGFVSGTNGTIASFGNNYNSGSGAPNTTLPVQ